MSLNERLSMLYRQIIMENSQKQTYRGLVDDFTHETTVYNPSCGDKLHLTIKLDDQKQIKKIAFEGQGCTISQASASLMCQLVQGKSEKDALKLSHLFSDLAMGKKHTKEEISQLEDAQVLTSIMEFPARIKCATLSWWGLDRALLGEDEEENND